MTRSILDADYSSVESRIVCWLAGQEDALQEYREGVDRYKRMAAFVYGIAEGEVNKFPQRFVGKGLILGAGFGLGAPKFRVTCKRPPGNYDLPEGMEFKAIKAWRKKHSKVVKFWDLLDDAAKSAVLHKGEVFQAGQFISFKVITTGKIEFLLMRLPSGRKLAYPWPKIVPGKFEGTTAVSFYQNLKGVLWGWNSGIWGGVWAENCLGGKTQVLSKQRGWIQLHHLTTEDHLWDGVKFVQHRGLVCKGKQTVIDYHGVLATPDHKFLIDGQWQSAGNVSKAVTEKDVGVYDILDCGPRQRFAVKAHDGRLLIAHNCTQAVAADIMCHGAQNAEDAGYEIAALIHDQALAYHQPHQSPEEFVQLLTDLPSWAAGLPLAAEGALVPFYKKD